LLKNIFQRGAIHGHSCYCSKTGGLKNLPTTIRPKIDPQDVHVPEGYHVEVVAAGLSFPCGMGFADDGTLYILEGGSTWPTRPAMLPRILRLDPKATLDVFGVEVFGGPRAVTYRDGYIYVSVKGGYFASIVRYDVKTGEHQVLVDKIPSGGWHEPGGPVFGPHDGLMYFANGSVSQNGVVLPSGFTVDIAKHPHAYDVPGQDVVLTGNNVWTRNPIAPFPFLVQTGPFKPFGQAAAKGEIIKGELWCSTGVWRSNPDGSNPELLAWGIRNPYGMAFSIHQLLLINLNALGAFAIAEQLGLALGLKEIIDITFQITLEKQAHQLILQEYMLETAPISILYQISV